MGIPLYIICCFSLAAFNIFSLYLIFDILINMCLGVFLLGFILYGTLCFLDLIDYFHSHIREIFNNNHFKYFVSLFLFLFFFWNPCNSNVGVFNVVPEVSETVMILFILFSLFFSVVVISTISSSRSLIRSSASVNLLLIPHIEFFISFIVWFLIVCSLVLLG